MLGTMACAQRSTELPEAPQVTCQQQNPTSSSQASGSQSASSSSQTVLAGQTSNPQDAQQKAQEQLKREEKQRIRGVVPNFNTAYDENAAPLTWKQKFQLD